MNKPELTMIELFAGTGMQRRGAENTELFDIEILATSDIEKDAMLAYAACHCGLTNDVVDNYDNYPSREQMVEELKERNIGMDFEKNKMYAWEKLIKKKTKDLEKYWLAMKLQNNLGDISKIKELPLADFWFYSSCCQDLSIAGKLKGMAKGSGTRSGLLWEVERLLEKAVETNTQPKYLCLENVKNMVGKQFKPDFDLWIMRLEELGYNTYYKVLNAKECGRCQNRERIFAMSIRKDIDTGKFTFPIPFDTGIRLKDILETNVDEKYYINTDRASNLIQQLIDKGQLKGQRECCDMSDNNPNIKDTANTIVQRYDKGISARRAEGTAVAEPNTSIENQPILVKNKGEEYVKDLDNSVTLKARDWKGWDNYGSTAIVESEILNTSKRIGGLFDGETRHQAGSVWNSNGMSPTIDTCQGGYREPCIIEDTAETNQNNRETKSVWRDINSHYKISSKGVVVDVVNKCQVEEIDGKVELEVKGKMAKFPIDALMKKYFAEEEQEPEVIYIKQATKKGYIECELPGCADLSYPSSTTRRGRVQDNGQTSPTITATETGVHYIESVYRIRKLTPKECWLLMGMTFEDCQKCMDIGLSNSALYRIAGNGIVTDCIKLLFEHLYKAQYDESYICTDEKMQNFQKPEA